MLAYDENPLWYTYMYTFLELEVHCPVSVIRLFLDCKIISVEILSNSTCFQCYLEHLEMYLLVWWKPFISSQYCNENSKELRILHSIRGFNLFENPINLMQRLHVPKNMIEALNVSISILKILSYINTI